MGRVTVGGVEGSEKTREVRLSGRGRTPLNILSPTKISDCRSTPLVGVMIDML